MTDLEYVDFTQQFTLQTGIDLGNYKQEQIRKRLALLYHKGSFHSIGDSDSLLFNSGFVQEITGQITAHITEFYRNPEVWEYLHHSALPGLLQKRASLNCWSAGCSTGEEAYTLAMILEEMDIETYSIVASDLNDSLLTKAKQGLYREKALGSLPSGLKLKYLRKFGTHYSVHKDMKKAVSFERQNLLHGRLESGFDLILCRNVIMYLTEEANHYLLSRLSSAMCPGGILVVGSRDSIPEPEHYGLIKLNSFFFQKRERV
ncbi:CheR family methyltransferase [Bacillus sp. EB01]|uniref:CheR family methyltransferase n=1 Tax=Bacillus sp. EB01 TaxID=1347086 RepID=UPI0005C791FA|nr:protein-glutamate O-methyltransferase CheR [Bacillus sp. EB01]